MSYSFFCYGHPNITSKHKNTFEFTKDSFVTPTGDCIVGVKASFSLTEIKKFINSLEGTKIKIIISVDDIKEEINALVNKDFNSDHEMVIRKSDFLSDRTFAVRASKSSMDFSRGIVGEMGDTNSKIEVKIE